MIRELVTIGFLSAACIGFGGTVLSLLRPDAQALRGRGEAVAWAYVLGVGIVGWLGFLVGIAGGLGAASFATLGVAGCAGNWFMVRLLGDLRPESAVWRVSFVALLLLLAVAIIAIADVIEALAPPSDADSLAYHFALPKQFLSTGRIEFVPRAVDGAAPLLVQMTYAAALALGGERAMTLWTMLTGWAPGLLIYVTCRRRLSVEWSLALAAIFLSTPAVQYGAGSGQVEVRNAAFALLSAVAVARTAMTRDTATAIIAGLAAGFFAGSKVLGVLFVIAATVVMTLYCRRARPIFAFVVAAAGAGVQWYLWTWWHTGDPFFPALYPWIESLVEYRFWNDAVQTAFVADILEGEKGVPVSLTWFLLYPLVATFSGLPIFESGRTGLGMFLALIGPFAVAGAAWRRHAWRSGGLVVMGLIALFYYTFWFSAGSPQRVRHLLPVYPIILVATAIISVHWATARTLVSPLAFAAGLTIAVQTVGQFVYTQNFLRYVLSGESRDAYLERMVPLYAPIPWINAHLSPADRVVSIFRFHNYLVDVPVLDTNPTRQILVETHPGASDIHRFVMQLRNQGATYAVMLLSVPGSAPQHFFMMLEKLVEMNCAEPALRFDGRMAESRTIRRAPDAVVAGQVLRFRWDHCLR